MNTPRARPWYHGRPKGRGQAALALKGLDKFLA